MLKLTSLLLVAAILSLVSFSAHGQCPDPSPIPPSTPSWMDGGCQIVQVSGTCYAKVCYCVRYIGTGETQYLIKSVTPTSHDCDGMDPAILIHEAIDAFEALTGNVQPSELADYPCSGQGYKVTRYAVATCWQMPTPTSYDPWGIQYGQYSDGGYSPLVPCWGSTAWCAKACTYCLSAENTVQVTCTNTLYGEGCSDVATSSTWELDHCYFLGSCEW